MTRAIIAGPDPDDLGSALEAERADVTHIEGIPTGPVLDDAGIADADVFVLTDLDEATAIPVAKDRNPDVRVVVYSHDSLPDFVSGQTDLAMDPALFDVEMVAEELVGDADD